MTAYELKNIGILNGKGADFRCILWGISRDGAVNRLNKSELEDKGVLWILVQIRGKLIKMIKNADTKFDDYSILQVGVMN